MKKPKGKVILSILVIFVLSWRSLVGKRYLFNDPMTTHVDPETGKTIKAFNVLLLGSDARPGKRSAEPILLLLLRVSEDRIAMLSIPRYPGADTWARIPEDQCSCSLRGPELTAELVSDLIGQPIDKYMLVLGRLYGNH